MGRVRRPAARRRTAAMVGGAAYAAGERRGLGGEDQAPLHEGSPAVDASHRRQAHAALQI
jgi:hypothetical protein